MRELAARDAIIAVWVTNKRSLVRWVTGSLLPHWGATYEAEWIWLKVSVLYYVPPHLPRTLF